jgi:phosphonate transport system substrate-binding protein
MHSRFRRWLIGAACLLGGLLASPAPAAAPAPELVVALKPDKNPDSLLAEKAALERFLGEKLARPVRVIVPLTPAVIIEGFANGTVDLGYLSATDFARAGKLGGARLLLAGEFPNGQRSYRSLWLTLRERPYRDVTELRGRPVAFASKTSTSGFVVPLWDLRRRGLVSEKGNPEEFFGKGNVLFGVGYVSAVERVFAGEAEAAAVSDYVFEQDKHLTPDQRARLRVVQAQGPVPSHVIAARASLPAPEVAAVRAALLAFNETAHAGLRDRLFTTKLVVAGQREHLANLQEALELAERALTR